MPGAGTGEERSKAGKAVEFSKRPSRTVCESLENMYKFNAKILLFQSISTQAINTSLQTNQSSQQLLSTPSAMILTHKIIFLFSVPLAQAGILKRDPTVNWASVVSSRGDKLPDFSYCGYRNSDSALPTLGNGNIVLALPTKATDDIGPSLQQAINQASQNGGGTVRIPAGKFYMTAGIQLFNNVIVRGTGQKDTTIVLKRRPTKPVFTLGRFGIAPKADFGYRSRITNTYVPVRASSVTVKDASGFAVGQTVYIARPVTSSWVRMNGMSDLVLNGNHQDWISVRSLNLKTRQC